MHEGSRRAIIAAFLANLGIAISKFVGFAITGSASLLAEAIHSLADTGNQALLFLGGSPRQARPRPRSTRSATDASGSSGLRRGPRPVHARRRVRALRRHREAAPPSRARVPRRCDRDPARLGRARVAVVPHRAPREPTSRSRRARPGGSFIRRTKNPELPVVLLEDSGALVGLFFALIGVVLAKVTGEPSLGRRGQRRDRPAARRHRDRARGRDEGPADRRVGVAREAASRSPNAIKDSPEVQGIIHLRTEHLGPDELLVGVKVEFEPSLVDPRPGRRHRRGRAPHPRRGARGHA